MQQEGSTEEVLTIVYQPQSLFRVRAVTRCSATIPGSFLLPLFRDCCLNNNPFFFLALISLPGHAEAILQVAFSPDGKRLATGSGDTTVRIWDVSSQSPEFTCTSHKNWVLCLAWSPDGKRLVSGSMDSAVGHHLIIWIICKEDCK